MKLIYKNYNQIYQTTFNNIPVYVKHFSNRYLWENETLSNILLNKNGFRVPKIYKQSPQKNIYEIIRLPLLNSVLKTETSQIIKVLDFHKSFIKQKRDDFKVFSVNQIKNNVLKISYNLQTNNILDSDIVVKIKDRVAKFKIKEFSVVHGDFRTENIFISDKIALIDFEFTGIGDPNRDLAYLWVDCTNHNKNMNKFLRNEFLNLNYYNPAQFEFWVIYFHIMVLYNPRTSNKNLWLKNLRCLLENKL